MALQVIFDKLLDFPVFQGLAKDELETMVGQTKFDFHKYPPRKKIVEAGALCDKLYFLLSGKIEAKRESDDHGYIITEELRAPILQQSEAMFGRSQRFTHTITALTDVAIMTVDKTEVHKFLEKYPVLRLNMISRYASEIQRLSQLSWKHQSDDLTQRLVDFIAMRCMKVSGRKVVKIKMTQLAHELNDNRLNVSNVLNALDKDRLIQLRRGHFIIPAMEILVNRNAIKFS
ncbi:MAG: Crp/Fnr family transcriptional regulator [Prevotellaceae bacterium]|nr:Crp/Fnr family transcriptional regulator [Prevotellaceae bacterium]